MNKREEGAIYEQKAMDYLREHGFSIVDANYYTKHGEIDIVAYKEGVYVFVEVKHRKSDRFGNPYEAVTKEKQRRIMKSALVYGQSKRCLGHPMRFDIIDILQDRITHYENAFMMDARYMNY